MATASQCCEQEKAVDRRAAFARRPAHRGRARRRTPRRTLEDEPERGERVERSRPGRHDRVDLTRGDGGKGFPGTSTDGLLFVRRTVPSRDPAARGNAPHLPPRRGRGPSHRDDGAVAVGATPLALLFVVADLGLGPLSALATVPAGQVDAVVAPGATPLYAFTSLGLIFQGIFLLAAFFVALASMSRPVRANAAPDLLRASPARDARNAPRRHRLRPDLPPPRDRDHQHLDVPARRLHARPCARSRRR